MGRQENTLRQADAALTTESLFERGSGYEIIADHVAIAARPESDYMRQRVLRQNLSAADISAHRVLGTCKTLFPWFADVRASPLAFRGETPSDIAENFSRDLALELRGMFKAAGAFDEGSFDEYLEDEINASCRLERNYIERVLGACERWSKEPCAVVYWDIDETLGAPVSCSFREDTYRFWCTRPCQELLFKEIQRRYPSFSHGIFTDTRYDAIADRFDSDLRGIRHFFDPGEVCSSERLSRRFDLRMPKEELEALGIKDCASLASAAAAKILVIAELRHSGSPAMLIDNMEVDLSGSELEGWIVCQTPLSRDNCELVRRTAFSFFGDIPHQMAYALNASRSNGHDLG